MNIERFINFIISVQHDFSKIHYDSIDSTNEEAKRLIQKEQIKNSAILIADTQTQGKTTKANKTWYSPIGNLYMTYVYKVNDLNHLTKISSVVSVAILKTIQYFSISYDLKTINVKIKWPNDILINDKKLSGILIEIEKFKGETFAIIGTGINILKTPTLNSGNMATSLLDEGFYLSVNKFIKIYTRILKKLLNNLNDKTFVEIRNTILKHSYKIGENIKILMQDGKKISGKFVHIDKRGALILETKEGNMLQIISGSIID